MRHLGLSCILVLGFAASGCLERANAPVKGTVKFDGKPVSGATVSFLPESGSAEWVGRGTTDPSGAFELRDRDGRPGISAGSYRVTLSTERPEIEGAETFPPEYRDPDKTVLRSTVPQGGTAVEFDAKSKPPRGGA